MNIRAPRKPAGNTRGNTSDPPPAPEQERMKAEHKIAWHVRGGWCRRFAGDASRTYFGRVPAAEAVRACVREEERRRLGQEAEVRLSSLKVGQAANLFLTHLDQQHATGAISNEQRASYGDEVDRFVKQVGKNRRLSEMCKLDAPERIFRPLRATALTRGIFACEKHLIQVRTFLDWCSTTRRFCPAPFYADAFSVPSEKEKRAARKRERQDKGVAYWKPEEVRQIVEAARAAGCDRYAQVLLMLNGGMGATDLALLEDENVDWERRCLHTDRSKTLVPRVVPLWETTLAAMRDSRAQRPDAAKPEWANRFFLTPHGKPLVVQQLSEDRRKVRRTDALRNWFHGLFHGEDRKTWKKPAVRLRHLQKHRAGGHTLRSVFTTLSLGRGGDQNLEAIILGQQFNRPILEYYLRDEQREKLKAVVEHVRRQIWGELP